MRNKLISSVTGAIFSFAASGLAFAAGMPMNAPPVAPAPAPISWTGWYVGLNMGGGWGSRDYSYHPNDPAATFVVTHGSSTSVPSPTSADLSGLVGGIQLGYNWQLYQNWVFGLEADFDASGIDGFGLSNDPNAFSVARAHEQLTWFGTVRARAGYLWTQNLLAYVTGGFAYGHINQNVDFSFTTLGGAAFSTIGGFSAACGPPTGP